MYNLTGGLQSHGGAVNKTSLAFFLFLNVDLQVFITSDTVDSDA
jgi:hypothetical protein